MNCSIEDTAQGFLQGLKATLGEPNASLSLHEPRFEGKELDYVSDCIRTGWVSTVGAYVDKFESMISDASGGANAVATVNGTAALHICVLLAGVKPNDEVLMPSLTFVATANAVTYAQGIPHFCDSDPSGIGIDTEKLDRYLADTTTIKNGVCINTNTQRNIKALLIMHTFGHIQDMEAISTLAEKYNLVVIEDSAEALGSSYKSLAAGNHSTISALSFNGNKIITTGGGGAIVTRDKALAIRAKHITTTAKPLNSQAYFHDEIGYNYRLPNINAALGVAQLEQLDIYLKEKRALALRYQQSFKNINNCEFIAEPNDCISNYWLNTIRINNISESERNQIIELAQKNNFNCRPIWVPMHKLPMYSECPRMDLEQVNKLQWELINVPSSPFLNESGQP